MKSTTESTIQIDGSEGEGGGQVLRTALGLSLITGRRFYIRNIRAGRSKPGLMRQHLTCVNAAAQISQGAVDGAEIGSRELIFQPDTVRPGAYEFSVGTAGSTSLVLQTILPALMLGTEPSTIVLGGGTHNPFAPPFDFLEKTFFPHLARFGPQLTARLERPGFYPAGGGRMHLEVHPVKQLAPVEIIERGASVGRGVIAHIAGLSERIADRGFQIIVERMNWPRECFHAVKYAEGQGPGFVLCCELQFEHVCETFFGFGEKGVSTEKVVDGLVDEVRSYLAAKAPAGQYLADQLLIPMALAGGGTMHCTRLTRHVRTNMEIIEKFLPVLFTTDATAENEGRIQVSQL